LVLSILILENSGARRGDGRPGVIEGGPYPNWIVRACEDLSPRSSIARVRSLIDRDAFVQAV